MIFATAAAVLLALLFWITWIRRQYAFGRGGMMERVHQAVLSHLDYDGKGKLLDVGCGSGALSIRAALAWSETKVTGIDYWGAAYGYGQAMCEKNAAGEGVGSRCTFQHGDANWLTVSVGIESLALEEAHCPHNPLFSEVYNFSNSSLYSRAENYQGLNFTKFNGKTVDRTY